MPGINSPEPLEFFRVLRVCYSISHGAIAAKLSLDTASNSNRSPDQSVSAAAAAATTSRDAHASTSGADRATSSSPAGRRQSLACDGSTIRDAEIMSQMSGHSRLSPLNSVNNAPIVCYETFTPELVRDLNEEDAASGSGNVAPSCERLERMRETFSKVIAFLRNTGAIMQTSNKENVSCFGP